MAFVLAWGLRFRTARSNQEHKQRQNRGVHWMIQSIFPTKFALKFAVALAVALETAKAIAVQVDLTISHSVIKAHCR